MIEKEQKYTSAGEHTMRPIAYIRSDFPTKFGIPRQSGLVDALRSTVVFLPEYRIREALSGLEEFSHLWLIWEFSEALRRTWSPTVRPPKLGGNVRKGVFATRSPFRPNPIGLSCVRLESIEWDTPLGSVLHISGADLMDKTPIYDIKPYIPYADSHPEALGSFAEEHRSEQLQVRLPDEWREKLTAQQAEALLGILAQDPRPAYQKDPDRIYGFPFAGMEVKFTVDEQILTVHSILPAKSPE